MKRGLRNIIIAVIALGLLISGVSCDDTPTNSSWDNPEEFVLYDVNRYVDISLEGNRLPLEKEYGQELAQWGMWIWDSYMHTTKEPSIGDTERFDDACWVTVSDIVVARKEVSSAESTFYYVFYNDRWQLDRIVCKFFDSEGIEQTEMGFVLYGELE